MARFKNKEWNLTDKPVESTATVAVLMDIRDELKETNLHLSVLSARLELDSRVTKRIDKRLAKKVKLP